MVKLWVKEFEGFGPTVEVRQAAKNLSCPYPSQSFDLLVGWSRSSSLDPVAGRLDL